MNTKIYNTPGDGLTGAGETQSRQVSVNGKMSTRFAPEEEQFSNLTGELAANERS